jgi:hypothetical protein
MTAAAEPPEVAPGRPDDLPERRCVRCGAVGTHYLTCPDLRLPSDFRFGEGSGNRSGSAGGRQDAMRDTWT